MSHAPLPKDCFDIDTAAHILSVSAVELYKMLRNENWLHDKQFKHDKLHNLPKVWARKAGYLTTQERGYPAPYNKNTFQHYQVAILTRSGLEAIANIMNKTFILPSVIPLTVENAEKVQQQQPTTAQTEEREKALAELEAMGFLTRKAS